MFWKHLEKSSQKVFLAPLENPLLLYRLTSVQDASATLRIKTMENTNTHLFIQSGTHKYA